MPEAALEITSLSKSYPVGHLFARRPRPVLVDLSLRVDRGEVFGYLGANGSGKTTTLKILMGLLRPEKGTISILGRPLDDRAWRFQIGYLPEHPYLYDYLTPREYLDYVGRLFGMGKEARRARTHDLLKLVGLARAADVSMRRFSKGMVQRAGLAQALVNDPELRLPRRADVRPRSVGPAARARPHPGPEGARQDRLLLHAHPPRRGDALRPRGRPARGPSPRRWVAWTRS